MVHLEEGPPASRRRTGVRALATCVGLWLAAGLAAETVPRGPVYRWTERFVAEGEGDTVRVFARASAPQLLVLHRGDWLGLADLDAGKVDWYPAGALRAAAIELRLPRRSERSSSGSLWLEDGAADLLSPSGGRLRLAPRPPVRGALSSEALAEALPAYAVAARAYAADSRWRDELSKSAERLPEDTSLEVIFGSWCVSCEAYVPRLLGVTEPLDLPVRWIGVSPTGATRDPVVSERDVSRLPTLIVRQGNTELGRIDRIDALRRPERSLARLFSALAASR